MTAPTESRTMHSSPHEHGGAPHRSRSVAGHRAAVAELLAPLLTEARAETLLLRDALGKGLAQDIAAPLSLPPFANSQMDGFAINSADVPDGGAELRVVDPVPAGATPAALGARRCRPHHDRGHDSCRC